MKNKLPRYQITIEDGVNKQGQKLGLTQIAYVENPAVITKGVYLNSTKQTFKDALKGIVAAPALIPNLAIYRRDEELGEYEVEFTKEAILELREDFMENKGKVAFNLEHNSNLDAPSFILDSWITEDSATDPSFTKYGIELPKGSWFIVSKFTDMKYFNDVIVAEERFAYSIEGYLSLKMSKEKFNNNNNINKIDMEDLKLPNGEHLIGDKLYIVEEGVVVEVKDKPEEETVVEEEVVLEKVKEEEEEEEVKKLADEPAEVEEEEVVETPTMDEEAILAILQPKMDEIYKTIAELKTLVEGEKKEVEEFSNVELTRVEKFNLIKSKLKD